MSGNGVRSALLAVALGVAACASKKAPGPPDAGARPPAAQPQPPATAPHAAPEDFPWGALEKGAVGCTASADCVAARLGGGCWAVTRATLAEPFHEQYRAWIAAGLGRPSGSPPEVPPIEAPEVAASCGIDWAGVGCVSGRCELTPSDCEYGGMRRSECLDGGGAWGGCVNGRGRLPGCNAKTKDAGKACADSKDCEGACVKGACTAYKNYKGCGVMRDGQMLCEE